MKNVREGERSSDVQTTLLERLLAAAAEAARLLLSSKRRRKKKRGLPEVPDIIRFAFVHGGENGASSFGSFERSTLK